MNQQSILNPQRKWFHEPWVWLLIALPASAVLGGMVTIWIAVDSDDGLVVDDYYKRGLEINRKLDRDRAANKYDLVANVQISESQNMINVHLHANDEFLNPTKIILNFLHPTIKGQDQQLVLHDSAGGIYTGVLPPLINGNWYIQIEADDWRLLEEIFIGQ